MLNLRAMVFSAWNSGPARNPEKTVSTPFFHKEFASTTSAVAETLGEALESMARQGWCEPDRMFCIRLCLEEALVNAVVHGNRNEPSRQVTIRIYDEGESCRICVQDEGNGFDPEAMEMPDCDELGGRGVCLIKEYMEDVTFDYVNKCLEMVFKRGTFSERCM